MTPKLIKSAMAVVATVATLGGSVLPVAADNDGSKTTTINYTVTEAFAWSVPASVTFAKNGDATQTGTVTVTKNIIGSGKTLRIAINGDEDFTLKDGADASNTRKYQAFVGSSTTALAKGGSVLNVAAGTNSGSAAMKFTLDTATVEKAGTYTDTLAFTAVAAK